MAEAKVTILRVGDDPLAGEAESQRTPRTQTTRFFIIQESSSQTSCGGKAFKPTNENRWHQSTVNYQK
jgi:hypothetical protein